MVSTPLNGETGRQRKRRDGLPVGSIGMALLLVALLVALAAPRTVASYLLLPTEAPLQNLREQRRLGTEELADLGRRLEAAAGWSSAARIRTDLALVLLLMAEATGVNSAGGKARLEAAETLLIDGLARSPANTYPWMRLAHVRTLLNRPPRDIVVAVMASIWASPHEARLVVSRLDAVLTYWPLLSIDDLDIVRQQSRFAWTIPEARQPLVDVARRRFAAAQVRAALQGTDAPEFDRLLAAKR